MASVIDLRSDVFATPTDEMWATMRAAEPGWAFFGQDPSVNQLEALTADLLGKEAALFVPSCTTANLVALMTLAPRGSRVVTEASSHIATSEAAGLAQLVGIVPIPVVGVAGRPTVEAVAAAFESTAGEAGSQTPLLCLENTHNTAGGLILTPEQTDALAEVAHRHDARVHLDGARLFNAAVALGVPASRLTAGADTVSISLNKGLGAPFGAMLAGPRATITEARGHAHRLGVAGIHLAGILAAAGLVALTAGIERLAEDHRRARTLARQIAEAPGLRIDLAAVQTNIVAVDVSAGGIDAEGFVAGLAERGVLGYRRSPTLVRFVTHRQIGDREIERAAAAIISTARG
jgi:threonine aldolase